MFKDVEIAIEPKHRQSFISFPNSTIYDEF